MCILPPHHTKHPPWTPNTLLSPYLWDLFVNWYYSSSRIYRTPNSNYTYPFLPNVIIHTVNLSLLTLNKNISSQFGQELKPLPLNHVLNTLSPAQWLNTKKVQISLPHHNSNPDPVLYRYNILLLSQSDQFKFLFNFLIISPFLITPSANLRCILQKLRIRAGTSE